MAKTTGKKKKGHIKSAYVPPKIDVYVAEASQLLAGTNLQTIFSGSHGDALDNPILTTGAARHKTALDNGTFELAGAKEDFGFGVTFSDVWEE